MWHVDICIGASRRCCSFASPDGWFFGLIFQPMTFPTEGAFDILRTQRCPLNIAIFVVRLIRSVGAFLATSTYVKRGASPFCCPTLLSQGFPHRNPFVSPSPQKKGCVKSTNSIKQKHSNFVLRHRLVATGLGDSEFPFCVLRLKQ